MVASFIDDDIIEVSVPETWKSKYSLSVASRDMTKLLRLIDQNKKAGVLIHVATINFDTDAKRMIMRRLKDLSAVALIAKSNTHRLIANFFIFMQKRTVPVKAFVNKEDALEWLGQEISIAKLDQIAL